MRGGTQRYAIPRYQMGKLKYFISSSGNLTYNRCAYGRICAPASRRSMYEYTTLLYNAQT